MNYNPARTDGSGASDQPGRSMSWTTFFTDAPVRVRVTTADGAADGVVVRPTRHAIKPEKTAERAVEFTLAPGQKVSVEFPHAIRASAFTGPLPCVAGSDVARLKPGPHAAGAEGVRPAERFAGPHVPHGRFPPTATAIREPSGVRAM